MNVDIVDLYKNTEFYLSKKVLLRGWIRYNRIGKNCGFIELNDGTIFKNIQIIYENTLDNFDIVTTLLTGVSIEVEGELVKSVGHKQNFEIKADRITIIGNIANDYPLQKKRHGFEFLRENAHIRGRTNTFSVIFHLRSFLAQETHRYFQEKNFMYLHAPIITSSDAEGAGEMFEVISKRDIENKKFFGQSAHLSVSGQLNAEAFAMAFQKVYTFAPTFRAENSNTTRHAAEFWMVEPEVAFYRLTDNIALAEDYVKFLVKRLLDEKKDELKFCDQYLEKGLIEKLEKFLKTKIPIVTYTEAINILLASQEKFAYPVSWGVDLKTEHERYLTEKVYKGAIFVINYPQKIKAFYMKRNEDNETVAAMDLLVPGIGELIGGSEREDRLEYLEQSMHDFGLIKDTYQWYLDLRRYGSTPHSGFGMGFERLLMFVTGIDNIRDVLPFPRTPGQIKY